MSDSGSAGQPPSGGAEEVLRYLMESDDHVLTTSEVADGVGVARKTALRRLSELAERGAVERKEVGEGKSVWWVSPSGQGTAAPAAPLRRLVGALDEETAAAARARSAEWRESVDEEL